MKRIKRAISSWLGFSGKEVNGFLILIPLMILLIFSEPVYRWWLSSHPRNSGEDASILDSLVVLMNRSKANRDSVTGIHNVSDSLFAFNPNKTDVEALKLLGFSKQLSNRIASYRQKGGVFRVKADLLKIYGLDSALYSRLYSYILLPESIESAGNTRSAFKAVGTKSSIRFDINKADTIQLQKIYGIGPKLAHRIVRFREALGGFHSTMQYSEVYGLDTAVVNRLMRSSFIADDFHPVKINMNTADEEILSAHPYINKKLAKAIIGYRFQHGNFASIDELRNIAIVKPGDADKLMPYLTVN